MIIDRLSIAKWLLRAMFGGLAADGDSTGGRAESSSEEQASAHAPLDVLKARCAAAWRDWPVRVGTRPFRAKQWQYFYPVEDASEIDDGVVLEPYDGQVKTIFLDDDQQPLSRKGGGL